ncbi:hypothetical protein [Undibacterium rugosum]|uniref:hypothetical protein n=1 Tax=Undibacterium rugosum TaxID=2762291 RepID=UPI001B82DDA1|nr:hypothetical protein [Undibacterium rugosum]MBR7780212.1 hypothetical protein [Undibacterium rugosum]
MKYLKIIFLTVIGIAVLIAALISVNHFHLFHCSTDKPLVDRSAQMVTVVALTSAIVQVNPFNFEYQKGFIRIFLTSELYEKVSKEMQVRIEYIKKAGRFDGDYFVFRSYQYDEKLNKHFVMGDIRSLSSATVMINKAYVYEYRIHTDGGNAIADEISIYPGTISHDSDWLAKQKIIGNELTSQKLK